MARARAALARFGVWLLALVVWRSARARRARGSVERAGVKLFEADADATVIVAPLRWPASSSPHFTPAAAAVAGELAHVDVAVAAHVDVAVAEAEAAATKLVIIRAHQIKDILSPKATRTHVECDCGWDCTEDTQRRAFELYDEHVQDAIAAYRRFEELRRRAREVH